MEIKELITFAPITISFLALAYAYLSNTKKYELKYQHRCEVLKWYNETINILMRLKHECQSNSQVDEQFKLELLSKLSAEIEVGRFYFPNIDKGDGFGDEKPFAYRGYRNLLLDFLVYSYRLYSRKDANNLIKHAIVLEQQFTSLLFEILNPKEFLKEIKKTTKKTFTRELIFEDFISENPEVIREYI